LKRQRRTMIKAATVILLVAGFTGIGTAYAYWTDQLNITASLKTGNFGLQFAPAQQCSVRLQQPGLEQETGVKATLTGDGRSLIINFDEGMPETFLQGQYLVVEYPLIQPEAGSAPVAAKEANLVEPEAKAILAAENFVLRLGEKEYPMSSCPEGIPATLEVQATQGIAYAESGEATGTLYLKLTEESVALAKTREKAVVLPAGTLPEEVQGQEGALAVQYRLQLPLAFTQGA